VVSSSIFLYLPLSSSTHNYYCPRSKGGRELFRQRNIFSFDSLTPWLLDSLELLLSEFPWHPALCIISSTQIIRFAYTFPHNHILHIDTQKSTRCIETSIQAPFVHFSYFDQKVYSLRGKMSVPTCGLTSDYMLKWVLSRAKKLFSLGKIIFSHGEC